MELGGWFLYGDCIGSLLDFRACLKIGPAVLAILTGTCSFIPGFRLPLFSDNLVSTFVYPSGH